MFKTSSKGGAAQFCAEIELLLCCARTCVDSKTAARVKVLLRQGVDLAYLMRVARCHGVLPLVYWNLHKICPVSTAVLDQLRDYFRTNTVRNIILAEELIEILKLLKAQNILAIPFKGPVLAALGYGNLALRQIGDLDLWVHERDCAAAQTVLESRGYRLELQAPWESCFVRNDRKMAMEVDLHTGITPPDFPFALDFEHLCERLRHVELSTRIVPSFSPEDVLMILCVQVAKDAWESRNRLLQLCDIRAVIDSQQTIDWRNLMRRARTMGCQRMALLGFRLVHELLEASVPTDILQEAAAHAGSKPFVSECVRCFLEPRPLAFPAVLFRDITQSIGRAIGSVTLCGTFTSGKTGHLWRCHDFFLAMDKAAVQMFAAPIEGTLKNFVEPDQIYIGCTSDLRQRLKEHNWGMSPQTAGYRP